MLARRLETEELMDDPALDAGTYHAVLHDLAKVKGCIKCLKCGFKFDCNGW